MKQLSKLALLGSTLMLALTLTTGAALAVEGCGGSLDPSATESCFAASENSVTLVPQFGFANLSQAINTIVTVAIFGAALVAFGFIVFGAFRYVSAGENADGTKAARVIITNSVVGLILIALVYVIFQILIRVVPGLSQFFSGV